MTSTQKRGAEMGYYTPERISISPVYRQKRDDDYYLVDRDAFPGKGTEYIRTDIHQAEIERLTAEVADLVENNHLKADAIDNWTNTSAAQYQEIEELKAVNDELLAALNELVTCVEDGCYCSEMTMATAVDVARAAIAKAKGGDS